MTTCLKKARLQNPVLTRTERISERITIITIYCQLATQYEQELKIEEEKVNKQLINTNNNGFC